MNKLKVGDMAPQFDGLNQDGERISLDDFKGRKLILYFYPKDDTPGCTKESCNLNENYNSWIDKGFEVIGVSPDSVKSHKKFAEKYNLKFNLIADTEKRILIDYDVWGEKQMYGRKYMGVLRTTFIIDENRKIIQIFEKVEKEDHTNQILKTINL